jgi:AGCS family alanine or glycine:cation symporter
MTLLAFVNLIALAMLFNVGMRLLRDYDQQRKADIKTSIFDSSRFKDLDLDLQAWPHRQQTGNVMPDSVTQVTPAFAMR